MDSNYIIETKNLTKQYGSQKSVADLNIHVKRGRIYGLLGRNGAGKTTTMKMLLGLTKPTSGEVKIWGKSLQGNEKKLLPRIGSLIESPGFYPNLTGTENLRIFATLRGVPNNHAIKDALDKQYGSQKSVADLNIHVKRGRIYGLLGRNGAGKTTTMKMLLGLTKPTSGEVKIWGKSLQGNEKKLLPRIGSLIESPGFYPNLTGTENLRIFATLRGVPNNHAIKDALDLVGLPYKDKKLFSQYSLGMKQRLAIALAVMHDPELLILDEPINGLDPIGIAEVRSFIRELCDARGKTILISSHILSEISLLADDIGIIDHGALLEEESLAELEQKSSKHIRFTISDTAQAARILERNFHETHFSIQDDHNLRLHNMELPVGKIVTAFVENGLEVSEAHTCEESLEDYFKRVTGGEGIA